MYICICRLASTRLRKAPNASATPETPPEKDARRPRSGFDSGRILISSKVEFRGP